MPPIASTRRERSTGLCCEALRPLVLKQHPIMMLKGEKPKLSKRFPPTRNFAFLENFEMAAIARRHNMKITVRPFQI